MIKNNPFITVLLLFTLEVISLNFLAYIEYNPLKNNEVFLPAVFFSVPVASILILNFFTGGSYKKSFKYFTIFLIITSLLLYTAADYFSGLGKAYQH